MSNTKENLYFSAVSSMMYLFLLTVEGRINHPSLNRELTTFLLRLELSLKDETQKETVDNEARLFKKEYNRTSFVRHVPKNIWEEELNRTIKSLLGRESEILFNFFAQEI